MQRLLTFISLFIASPGLIIAEAQEPKDRLLIVGSPSKINSLVGSGQTLEPEDMERHSYTDVHRLLRQIPGVNIHEEEGVGLFPHIGIRGTRLERNSRITLLEDGVLMSPAPYAAPAAYYFPSTSRMNRIEVRKGSAAIKTGPYTTGGAINLITTPIPSQFNGYAKSLFGSYNSSEHHLWVGNTSGSWSWLVEGLEQSSDGFKQLDNSLYNGRNMPRPHTGFDRRGALVKLAWNSGANQLYQRWELKYSTDQLSANESYLGLSKPDYNANPLRRYAGSQQDAINSTHQHVQLKHVLQPTTNIDIATTIYRTNFARNWYKLASVQNEAGGSFTGISNILESPDSNANAFAWLKGYPQTDVLGIVRANNREYVSEGIQSTLGLSIEGENQSHDLEVGLRFHRDREDRYQWDDSYQMKNGFMSLVKKENRSDATLGIPGSQDNRIAEAEAFAFYIQDEWQLGKLKLVPGIRYENILQKRTDYVKGENPSRATETKEREKKTSVWLPGVGLSYELTDRYLLLVGAHKGFAPTGNDPEVKDETSVNYELGLRFTKSNLHVEATSFLTSYENLTGSCAASTGGTCVEGDLFNAGKVNVYGLEAMLISNSLKLGTYKIPIRLAYTWTKSRFETSFSSIFPEWEEVKKGDELAQIPEHQVNLGLGLSSSAWGFDLNTNFVSQTRSVAGQGSIPENEQIDSRIIIDLAGYYEVFDQAKMIFSAENITDKRYLVARRPAGLRPGAPRTMRIGLEYQL